MTKAPKGDSGPSPYELQRKAAQRAALNALKRARRSAEQAGVSLSEWEDEFLASVDERVREHGRAFADPELGAPGQALSAMQGRKLKEITRKAKGETPRGRWKPLPVRQLDEPDPD
ncbi:hypothetical protein [Brevundimonas vesicularis]|uniref:hypothetical protein n=1 Tax=Brevundimonas vesicularis TaxID=41276 RepID=UPI0038D35FF7